MPRIIDALRNLKHLFAPLTANCREFHDRWTHARRDEGPLAGRWEGEWVSTATGHGGLLRAVLQPHDDNRCLASFHAAYAAGLRACYSTELTISRDGDCWRLAGESDIGWLAGGIYRYDGEATTDALTCRYRNKYDHGEFRLRRL